MDDSVVAPNKVTLRCQADGQPTPEIVWIKNGDDQFTLTANNADIDETTDGMNKTSILTIEPSSPQDTGTYSCRAQNILSNTTSSEAQVNVFGKCLHCSVLLILELERCLFPGHDSSLKHSANFILLFSQYGPQSACLEMVKFLL